jgi:hypothetical protein
VNNSYPPLAKIGIKLIRIGADEKLKIESLAKMAITVLLFRLAMGGRPRSGVFLSEGFG